MLETKPEHSVIHSKHKDEKNIDHIPFSISILNETHIEAAAELFTRSFCDSEPLTQCLHIPYHDFMPFAREVVTKAATDELSIVAIDKEGEVIGCAIAEDFCDPIKPQLAHPKLKPIFTLLEQLSEDFYSKNYMRNLVIHIWVTAVSDKARGVGLSTILNNACVTRSVEKHFRYVYSEFTNAKNETIMKRYPDNIKLNTIPFNEFVFEDEKPFASLEGHASCYICTAAPYFRLFELIGNTTNNHDAKVADKMD